MIKWDASHPIRWISSRGIYSEHWIGIAEKNKNKTGIVKPGISELFGKLKSSLLPGSSLSCRRFVHKRVSKSLLMPNT